MSKKTDIWMPFYVADYLADTQRLTTEQHGAYLLLILDYWRNGPPPDDDRVLAQITRLSPDAWSSARSMLEQCFTVAEGIWYHGRIEEELQKAKANKEFAENRARAGAEALWKKKRQAQLDASSNAQSNASSNQQALLNRCTSPSPSPSEESTNVDSNNTHSAECFPVVAQEPKAKTTYTARDLVSVGVDETIARDFMEVRKRKKAPLTETAMRGIAREAKTAGYTINQALQVCAERNWQSFKADWVRDKSGSGFVSYYELATGQRPEF